MGDSGTLARAALVALTFERPIAGRRVGFRISAGSATARPPRRSGAKPPFARLPARVGAYLPIQLPLGQLEPGIGVGVNVITVGVTDDSAPATGLRAPGSAPAGSAPAPGPMSPSAGR